MERRGPPRRGWPARAGSRWLGLEMGSVRIWRGKARVFWWGLIWSPEPSAKDYWQARSEVLVRVEALAVVLVVVLEMVRAIPQKREVPRSRPGVVGCGVREVPRLLAFARLKRVVGWKAAPGTRRVWLSKTACRDSSSVLENSSLAWGWSFPLRPIFPYHRRPAGRSRRRCRKGKGQSLDRSAPFPAPSEGSALARAARCCA